MDNQSLLSLMLIHQTTIKILHFQSKKRTEHTDLDNYYSKFSENMDKFIECISFEEKLSISKIHLKIEIPESSVDYLLDFRSDLFELSNSNILEKHVATIIDDMLLDIDRTVYLLNFL